MEPLLFLAVIALLAVFGIASGRGGSRRGSRRPPSRRDHRAPRSQRPLRRGYYPGDYRGKVTAVYSPKPDGRPDPGEIVWTWVPFEDDPYQGKDRPVLLVGKEGRWLLALMLTSKDHHQDASDEARWGRRWMDIGTGAWDARRRPSEVRLDRVIRVDPDDVRREGAVLDRATFERVARAL